MPAPLVYSLIYRLAAYPGVTRGLWLAQQDSKAPALPAGPREVKGSEWLAERPHVMDQISATPIRSRPKGR